YHAEVHEHFAARRASAASGRTRRHPADARRRDEIEAGLPLYAIPQAPAEPHRRGVRAIAGRVVHAHERTHLEGCVDPVKLVAEAAAESGHRRAAVPQLRFVDAHTAEERALDAVRDAGAIVLEVIGALVVDVKACLPLPELGGSLTGLRSAARERRARRNRQERQQSMNSHGSLRQWEVLRTSLRLLNRRCYRTNSTRSR